MTYKIAWMFPDILFMHGERGNVEAVKRYASIYGYNVEVDRIDYDSVDFDPNNYDILLFGVGEISSFESIIEWLKPVNDKLKKYIESGRPMLVSGTTQCIFADKIIRSSGKTISGLSYFPATATEREYVYGDDIIADCKYNGKKMQIVGSQIMMIDFEENDDTHDNFSQLIYGYGNCGKNRNEGFIIKNAIFTNILGPMLICNPWLTVEMIKSSALFRGDKLKEIDVSFKLERDSAEAKYQFNISKKTNLTNCK